MALGGHGIDTKDTSELSIHTRYGIALILASASRMTGFALGRMGEFLKKLNELNQKHVQSGGTLWLPRPPQLPLAIEESRTLFVLKARMEPSSASSCFGDVLTQHSTGLAYVEGERHASHDGAG